jgi:hypothetical protein
VQFDLNGTGQTRQVGWASATDGLLVMDRNGDGKINDGRELFGTATENANGQRSGDGYTAMSLLDSNGDGLLSAADVDFANLQLWVDANSDGITDAGELQGLDQYGITSLDLNAQHGTQVDHGNVLGLTSSYTTADGQQHDMADVWFAKDLGTQVTLDDVVTAPTSDVISLGDTATATVVASVGVTTSQTSSADYAALALTKTSLVDEERMLPLI